MKWIIVRWAVFIPAAFASIFLTYYGMYFLLSFGLRYMFIEPDNVFGQIYLNVFTSVFMGIVYINVGLFVAPQKTKFVLYLLLILFVIFIVFFGYFAIIQKDYKAITSDVFFSISTLWCFFYNLKPIKKNST